MGNFHVVLSFTIFYNFEAHQIFFFFIPAHFPRIIFIQDQDQVHLAFFGLFCLLINKSSNSDSSSIFSFFFGCCLLVVVVHGFS